MQRTRNTRHDMNIHANGMGRECNGMYERERKYMKKGKPIKAMHCADMNKGSHKKNYNEK